MERECSSSPHITVFTGDDVFLDGRALLGSAMGARKLPTNYARVKAPRAVVEASTMFQLSGAGCVTVRPKVDALYFALGIVKIHEL